MTENESIAENNLAHVIAINEILPKKMPDKYTSKEDFKFEIKGYKTIPNYNGRRIIMFIKKGIDYKHSTEFDEILKCSILIKIKSNITCPNVESGEASLHCPSQVKSSRKSSWKE